MATLKFDENVYVDIIVFEENLVGDFEVDNIKLYEAAPEDATVGLPNIDNNSPITTLYDDNNGNILKQTIQKDSLYMEQTYGYSEDGSKLTSVTDYNGLTTHYSYNEAGLLTATGYELDTNGNILNPITFEYNAKNKLQRTSQIITDVVDSSRKNIRVKYNHDTEGRIKSVSYNNITYYFTYDENGNVDITSKKTAQQETVILTDHTYTSDNMLNTIDYLDGKKVIFQYNDNGNISEISTYNVVKESSPIEKEYHTLLDKYSYTYDEFGNLQTALAEYSFPENYFADDEDSGANNNTETETNETTIEKSVAPDDGTNYKIEYTSTGYKLYNIINNSEVLVFEKVETDDEYIESHRSTMDGQNILETFRQTKKNYSKDINTGSTTISSNISGNKVSAFENGTSAEYNVVNSTTTDAFDRVVNRDIVVNTDITNTTDEIREADMHMTQNYAYVSEAVETLNKTTNKLSSQNITVQGQMNVNNVIEQTSWSENNHFIYDDNGRLQLVYEKIDDEYVLKRFYAYDEAGQIVTDASSEGIHQYAYNLNGNLSKKYTYASLSDVTINNLTTIEYNSIHSIEETQWDNYNFDSIRSKDLTLSGEPSKMVEILYSYDKVTNYIEHTYDYSADNEDTITINVPITYDDFGNPLRHVEFNVLGMIVSDLTWEGNQLSTAIIYEADSTINKDYKFVYKYDENGYRSEKIRYQYNASSNSFNKDLRYKYIWDNGELQSIHAFEYAETLTSETYINLLYDEKGYPCGYVDYTGTPYYFLRDINNSVTGLISGDGVREISFSYDAFGAVKMQAHGSSSLENIFLMILAQFNPCSYKGYFYDYETGMYFIKNRSYSPSMGRFIDQNIDGIADSHESPFEANTSIFCNNDSINNNDVYGSWGRQIESINWNSNVLNIEMNKAFTSTSFCAMYANQLVKQQGIFDTTKGYTYQGMTSEQIASTLFAKSIGKYAEGALNRVNATWGDGWIISNRSEQAIKIIPNDPNSEKYLKIWYAAENIRNEAMKDGIFLTV